MSVDDLMDRARPLATSGVPKKSTIQKSLGVGWKKASDVYDQLSREASEAARDRANQRRAKLRRGGVRETAVRRLRAPRTVLPPVPVSPWVYSTPAPEIPQVDPAGPRVDEPFTTNLPVPSETPAEELTAPVVRAPAERVSEEPVAERPTPSPAPSGRRPHRVHSWPLLLLALPAFVAIWSGWVGLGGLTGFGVVHPLPGILDSVKLNTAITLPVGLETYAAYALYVWLGSGAVGRARVFAMWSAISSLALGAAGQVAYHLMAAFHMSSAPWQITTIVACLPVAVVGMGAALYHLVHAEEVDGDE